jgi:hypothetical protein
MATDIMPPIRGAPADQLCTALGSRGRLDIVFGELRPQAPEGVGGQLHGFGPLDTAVVVANADGLECRIVGAQRLEHHETVDDLAHVDGVTPLV